MSELQRAFPFLAQEPITYYPEGNLGAGFVVTAAVFWQRTTPQGRHLRRSAELYVPVSGLEAEGVTRVVRGKDLVDVQLAGATHRLRITVILDSDPGVFRLLGVD